MPLSSTAFDALQRRDLLQISGLELAARIQARTAILVSFASISSALIGAAAAQQGFAFVGIGVGFLALVTAMLNAHHETMITYIQLYQKALNQGNAELPTLLDFHPDELKRVRQQRDFGQYVLYSLLGSTALLIAGFREMRAPTPGLSDVKWALFWLSGISLISALLVIWNTQQRREQLTRTMESPTD